jgi:hypothetical protein
LCSDSLHLPLARDQHCRRQRCNPHKDSSSSQTKMQPTQGQF